MKIAGSCLLLIVAIISLGAASRPSTDLAREKAIVESKDETILIRESSKHFFSNNKSLDTFSLILKGKKLIDAEATFSITNSSGKEIYSERFPASYLIGYEILDENPTQEQQEEVIKRRAKEFFKEENFKSPAIEADEEFEEDYSDKKIWKDIKSDKTAVGFYYLIGEGSMLWIAYSKKNKKVVNYHHCC